MELGLGLDLPEFLLTNYIHLVYTTVLTLTLTLISHLHRLKVYELQMSSKVFIIREFQKTENLEILWGS